MENYSGNLVMSLVLLTTGVRPIILLRLTVGYYFSKMPAFNVFDINGEDCEVLEESDASKILRRVNPHLPPKSKACEHQLALNCANCPEKCEFECLPDGMNIRVSWDKNSGTKGESSLHLLNEVKVYMDLYNLICMKKFTDRKWLMEG